MRHVQDTGKHMNLKGILGKINRLDTVNLLMVTFILLIIMEHRVDMLLMIKQNQDILWYLNINIPD